MGGIPTSTINAIPAVGSLPVDWIIIGAVFLVCAIDLYRSGPTRSASLSLGAIISLPLYLLLDKTAMIGTAVAALPPAGHAAIFAVLLAICYILMSRIVLPFAPGGNFIQTLFGALATCAILLSVIMQIPPIVALWHPTPLITTFFAAPYLAIWLLLSLTILAFTSL